MSTYLSLARRSGQPFLMPIEIFLDCRGAARGDAPIDRGNTKGGEEVEIGRIFFSADTRQDGCYGNRHCSKSRWMKDWRGDNPAAAARHWQDDVDGAWSNRQAGLDHAAHRRSAELHFDEGRIGRIRPFFKGLPASVFTSVRRTLREWL